MAEGEDENLENSQKDSERICHQFDAFCRKVLKDERKTFFAKQMKRRKREVSLSDLTSTQELHVSGTDAYPSEQHRFVVQGHEVFIQDERLAKLLEELPHEKRDLLLLAYYFGMRDWEIAKMLKLARSTVNYRRNTALDMLRKMDDDCNGDSEKRV